MTDIYVVTGGEYSDYRILGVYSTQEKAALARVCRGGDEVEEYVLDEHIEAYEQGLYSWHITMMYNGDTRMAVRSETRGIGTSFVTRRGQPGWLLDSVAWARDKEHAVKIVNEKRARLIAANLWPEDAPMAGEFRPVEV